jgi:hypothetical protein
VKEGGRKKHGGENTQVDKIARKNIEGNYRGRNILEMTHLSCIILSRGAKILARGRKFRCGGGNSGPKDGISGHPRISGARGGNSALVRTLRIRSKISKKKIGTN